MGTFYGQQPKDQEMPSKDVNPEELVDPGNFGQGQQLDGPSRSQPTSPVSNDSMTMTAMSLDKRLKCKTTNILQLDKDRMNQPSWMNRFNERGPLKFPSRNFTLKYYYYYYYFNVVYIASGEFI